MPTVDFDAPLSASRHAFSSIKDFLGSAPPLNAEEKRLIVNQALLLMNDLYVHLPLKRAMYAVDPVQRLRLLRSRTRDMNERAFHAEMISIFSSVRDLHTNYILPMPYRAATALLPFELEEFTHEGARKYLVSRLLLGLEHPTFVAGSVVTHWNGVAIDRAVAINGDRNAGSNEAARHAQGLARMTIRPLMMSLPPDEDWVDIRYISADGDVYEDRFEWRVLSPPAGDASEAASPTGADDPSLGLMLKVGVDAESEAVRAIKDELFDERVRQTTEAIRRALESGHESAGMYATVSRYPTIFEFKRLSPAGDYGYIRIKTFDAFETGGNADAVDSFVAEFRRILALMPEAGLVLDVRGNGGGIVTAGERLLQLLTDEAITPEPMHFIYTDEVLSLCERMPGWFQRWTPSLERSLRTGATFSQGWPLSTPEEVNDTGREYGGPVVLLIDASCYSTTDIFAAGFQDHGIGPILGTADATGAGGANVFTWELLNDIQAWTPGPSTVARLARGASFRVAIRRSTRVRQNAGMVLEDLGVEPEYRHDRTLDDLLHDDRDLLARAVELLHPAGS